MHIRCLPRGKGSAEKHKALATLWGCWPPTRGCEIKCYDKPRNQGGGNIGRCPNARLRRNGTPQIARGGVG